MGSSGVATPGEEVEAAGVVMTDETLGYGARILHVERMGWG